MIRMVTTLAELSRLEDPEDQLQYEPVHASEIIEAAWHPLIPEAGLRHVYLDREVGEDLHLAGDRRRLTLAVTNLMSNAVKHSPDRSAVKVRAFSDPKSMIHFVISDSGPGFAPDEADSLFHKYYRAANERRRKEPGSGLGLYIVRQVAERHGGTAMARSEVGQGAEFEIIVPRDHSRHEAPL